MSNVWNTLIDIQHFLEENFNFSDLEIKYSSKSRVWDALSEITIGEKTDRKHPFISISQSNSESDDHPHGSKSTFQFHYYEPEYWPNWAEESMERWRNNDETDLDHFFAKFVRKFSNRVMKVAEVPDMIKYINFENFNKVVEEHRFNKTTKKYNL